ncbi:MAG: hypothetical protein IPF51_03680 [Dehalococcoidia bacterium]|uniref:hypothetical protein n=1 Tax=Candidatus Amarobacter glycogenicus TaxID=3140699 RepID=UPI003135C411|nr:hypothetical protein [Dehalococcoidia bacterium]
MAVLIVASPEDERVLHPDQALAVGPADVAELVQELLRLRAGGVKHVQGCTGQQQRIDCCE